MVETPVFMHVGGRNGARWKRGGGRVGRGTTETGAQARVSNSAGPSFLVECDRQVQVILRSNRKFQ